MAMSTERTLTPYVLCWFVVIAVLKNWSLVLFGTGRRRRSTDSSGGVSGSDRHSWAAVRSSADNDYPSSAAALTSRSLGPCLIVLMGLLGLGVSRRQAGTTSSGRVT